MIRSAYLLAVMREMEERYGAALTDNPDEAGYVLPDGSLLKMGHGSRSDDHRIVAGFVRGKAGREAASGSRWDALVQWCKVTGSIRWMPESGSAELWTRPTREQIRSLVDLARMRGEMQEGFSLEMHGPRGKHAAREYEPWEAGQIRGDIEGFWS